MHAMHEKMQTFACWCFWFDVKGKAVNDVLDRSPQQYTQQKYADRVCNRCESDCLHDDKNDYRYKHNDRSDRVNVREEFKNGVLEHRDGFVLI
jgi:hypothetical protein